MGIIQGCCPTPLFRSPVHYQHPAPRAEGSTARGRLAVSASAWRGGGGGAAGPHASGARGSLAHGPASSTGRAADARADATARAAAAAAGLGAEAAAPAVAAVTAVAAVCATAVCTSNGTAK